MASTNKTSKLKLNSWVDTDRPQRNDFNSDNLIIDETLGEHVENTSIHLTSDEKSRVTRPVVATSYAGNGAASRTINLPYSAHMVIVYIDGGPMGGAFDATRQCINVYSAVAVSGGGASAGVRLAGNSLTVENETEASSGYRICLNETDVQYKVAVIK